MGKEKQVRKERFLGGEKRKKMKTKNKTLALVEIAIVLCSVLVVALPVIAADQTTQKEITTASEDDFTLEIYGNANEDDTIDMRDTTYIKLVIFGKKPKTELADANNDGKVSMLDVGQTKLIILGKEKELTLIDSWKEDVTVNKPIERIILLYQPLGHVVKSLGAEDKVVGINYGIQKRSILFPELCKLPSVASSWQDCNYEALIGLKPDAVFVIKSRYYPTLEEKVEPAGITVVRIDCALPSTYVKEVKAFGYILDKENEAEEFLDWYDSTLDEVQERTAELSEDEKPRVYFEDHSKYLTDVGGGEGGDTLFRYISTWTRCINIADDLGGDLWGTIEVDPEWVVEQNPSIIIKHICPPIDVGYETDDLSALKAVREEIMNRPELANVDAVKNGEVYAITYEFTWRGFYYGAPYIAKLLHPELFEDLDPRVTHQEWLSRFQRLDYNIYEHGAFVYPPVEW